MDIAYIQDESLQRRTSIKKGDKRKIIIVMSTKSDAQELEVTEFNVYHWFNDHLQQDIRFNYVQM